MDDTSAAAFVAQLAMISGRQRPELFEGSVAKEKNPIELCALGGMVLRYLTTASVLQCPHGGRVIYNEVSPTWEIEGKPVLTDRALMNASIVGCPLAAPGTKPCTQVIQIILGLASETEIDALTPLLDTVQFVTDGVPGGKSVLLPEAAGITESR